MMEGPKSFIQKINSEEASGLLDEHTALYKATLEERRAALGGAAESEAPRAPERLERKDYEEMIRQMREEVAILNADKEIQKNGFTYPVEWLDAFEGKMMAELAAGKEPDVGVFGYGSLQSKQSRGTTLGDEEQAKAGIGVMKGVRRGLYYNGSVATIFDWEYMGLNPDAAHSVMAIKHGEGARMNGVRIPISGEDLKKIADREWAYYLLPGPPADMREGGVADFNLVCWPLGRNLIDKYLSGEMANNKHVTEGLRKEFARVSALSREGAVTAMPISKEETEEIYKLQAGAEKILKDTWGETNVPSDVQYMALRGYLAAKKESYFGPDMTQAKERETFLKYTKAVLHAYERHIADFYKLSEHRPPHPAYIRVCMQLDEQAEIEEFIDTTFCYDPSDSEGKREITLREYLEKYDKKDSPDQRPNRDVQLRSPEERAQRFSTKFFPFVGLPKEEVEKVFGTEQERRQRRLTAPISDDSLA